MDGREVSNLVYGMLFGLDGSGLNSDVLAVVELRRAFACLRLCVTCTIRWKERAKFAILMQ